MKIKEEKEPTLQVWAPLFSIIWCLSQFSGSAQAESSTLGRSRLLVLIDSSFNVLGTHMEAKGMLHHGSQSTPHPMKQVWSARLIPLRGMEGHWGPVARKSQNKNWIWSHGLSNPRSPHFKIQIEFLIMQEEHCILLTPNNQRRSLLTQLPSQARMSFILSLCQYKCFS